MEQTAGKPANPNDKHWQVPPAERKDFILNNILAHLPFERRFDAKGRAYAIAQGYWGRDLEALSILSWAARDGHETLDDYCKKLDEHWNASCLYEIEVRYRCDSRKPQVAQTDVFFAICYRDLKMPPIPKPFWLTGQTQMFKSPYKAPGKA